MEKSLHVFPLSLEKKFLFNGIFKKNKFVYDGCKWQLRGIDFILKVISFEILPDATNGSTLQRHFQLAKYIKYIIDHSCLKQCAWSFKVLELNSFILAEDTSQCI